MTQSYIKKPIIQCYITESYINFKLNSTLDNVLLKFIDACDIEILMKESRNKSLQAEYHSSM